jgi:hypothetical protein
VAPHAACALNTRVVRTRLPRLRRRRGNDALALGAGAQGRGEDVKKTKTGENPKGNGGSQLAVRRASGSRGQTRKTLDTTSTIADHGNVRAPATMGYEVHGGGRAAAATQTITACRSGPAQEQGAYVKPKRASVTVIFDERGDGVVAADRTGQLASNA